MQKNTNKKILSRNKRATFDYEIKERFSAGISLFGHEAKSTIKGGMTLGNSFVRIEKGEPYLFNAYITLWKYTVNDNYDPERKRKLLLNKKEIRTLETKVRAHNLTIIPLFSFLSKGKVKMEIALARGRKKYDKREKLKKEEFKREKNKNNLKDF